MFLYMYLFLYQNLLLLLHLHLYNLNLYMGIMHVTLQQREARSMLTLNIGCVFSAWLSLFRDKHWHGDHTYHTKATRSKKYADMDIWCVFITWISFVFQQIQQYGIVIACHITATKSNKCDMDIWCVFFTWSLPFRNNVWHGGPCISCSMLTRSMLKQGVCWHAAINVDVQTHADQIVA